MAENSRIATPSIHNSVLEYSPDLVMEISIQQSLDILLRQELWKNGEGKLTDKHTVYTVHVPETGRKLNRIRRTYYYYVVPLFTITWSFEVLECIM